MTTNGTIPLRARLIGGPNDGDEALLPEPGVILRVPRDDALGGRYKLIGRGTLEPSEGGYEALIYQWTDDQDEIEE
jgi:hypothetical protein